LAEASDAKLTEFGQRHGIEAKRLERCREYLRTAAPFHGKFMLLALVRDADPDTEAQIVLRLVRHDGAWVELPTDFPHEHLLALLDLLQDV
jgi:hypothetical protein